MAITIPLARENAAVNPIRTDPPQFAKPTPAAFGADVAVADEQVGQKISEFGATLAKAIVNKRNQDEEQQVIATDTTFRQSLQDVLYNPEPGTGGAPKGIMDRSLGQARGATVQFQDAYADLRQKFLDQVPGDHQKAALAARMDAHYVSTRDLVVRHEAVQQDESYKNDLDANLKQRVSDAAALVDPTALSGAIDQAHVVQSEGMKKMGRSPDELKLSGQLLAGDMAKSAIGAVLERNPQQAQQLLDTVKARIGAGQAAAMQQTIDGKMFSDKSAALWDSMTGAGAFKLPDGNWDLGAMQAAVLDLKGEPQDKKEKLWDYVKARANEDLVARNHADQANDRSFYDAALQAKAQGAKLSDALKLSAGFNARDAYDIARRQEVIKGLFAPPVTTDPDTYISLWKSIQDGRGSLDDIATSLKNQALSINDYRTLTEDYYKIKADGVAPAQKQDFNRLEIMAKTAINDPKKEKEFLYEMQIQGKGLSSPELLKLATDKLKIDDSTRARILGYTVPLTGKTGYAADLARQDAQNLAWGTVYSELGKDNTMAIGRGLLSKGKPTWNVADVGAFASQFGGLQKIKQGTPVANAIQSLSSRGQLVTPGNVKAVLERYSDGKY